MCWTARTRRLRSCKLGIVDCGLRIADCGSRIDHFLNPQSAIRNRLSSGALRLGAVALLEFIERGFELRFQAVVNRLLIANRGERRPLVFEELQKFALEVTDAFDRDVVNVAVR